MKFKFFVSHNSDGSYFLNLCLRIKKKKKKFSLLLLLKVKMGEAMKLPRR